MEFEFEGVGGRTKCRDEIPDTASANIELTNDAERASGARTVPPRRGGVLRRVRVTGILMFAERSLGCAMLHKLWKLS